MFDSIRTSIANWLTPSKAKDDISTEALAMFHPLSMGRNPPRRGTEELLKAYREMPGLQAVVRRIAESFAAIEWSVYRTVGADGRSTRNRRLQRASHPTFGKMVKAGLDQGNLEELYDDPLLDLLERGNDCLSGFECRQVMATHLELKGEAFAWLERNPLGMPIRYWPLSPYWVRDIPTPGNPTYAVTLGGVEHAIDSQDIFAIHDPDPYEPYKRGVGVAESLADELDSDEYAAQFVKAFFYNDASPSAVIAFKDDQNVTEDVIRRIESEWSDKHRGANRAHRVHFLNREPSITTFDKSLKDLDMVDLRRFLRDIVRETWGMPPEIVGLIENSNRATIDSAMYLFAILLLVPRAERWRIAMQTQLVPQFDERKVVGYTSPVPEDKDYTLSVATAAPHMRSRAEWRELQGLEVNDGDHVYVMPIGVFEEPVDGTSPTFLGPPPPAPTSTSAASKSAPVQKVAAIEIGDIDNVLEQLRPQRLNAEIEEWYPDELESWGNRVLSDLSVDPSFNMLNPKVVEHLSEIAGEGTEPDGTPWRIKNINDTTLGRLRAQLVEGVEGGEDIRALSRRVRETFKEATEARSRVIARTEVLRSSNFGTHEAHVTSGVVAKRQWVATFDGRGRDEHVAADGQTVGLSQPFVLSDGTTAMYPGATGVAAHDINCRCTTVAVVEERTYDADERKELWRAYDKAAEKWEDRTASAFARGFKNQRGDILDELEKTAQRYGRA
jgi:phage portal protein BeeE